MLEQSRTQEADAIQKFVCEPIKKLTFQEMSVDAMGFMLELLKTDDKGIGEKAMKDRNCWSFQGCVGRVKASLTITVDNRSLIFLMFMYEGNIGVMIMLCYYMQYRCKQLNIKHVAFEEAFCKQIFAHGFPSKEDLHKIWDGAKVKREKNGSGSDNLIDYATASYSIQFGDFSETKKTEEETEIKKTI